jgi:hypothetical protein
MLNTVHPSEAKRQILPFAPRTATIFSPIGFLSIIVNVILIAVNTLRQPFAMFFVTARIVSPESNYAGAIWILNLSERRPS